jgi:hypothetical protein
MKAIEQFASVSLGVVLREVALRLEVDPSPDNVKAAAESLRQSADLIERQRKLIDQQRDWIVELRKGRKRRR